MRIISGFAKGQTLATPSNDRVRPTTDRVRESLFAILGRFDEAVVFDGFAGTGALGCEALSRGADFAYFADKHSASIALVEENLERIGATELAKVLAMPFERALTQLEHEPDVVFLDPPYDQGLAQAALETMSQAAKITTACLVVVEQSTDEEPAEHAEFDLDDERIYGSTRIRFLLRK